MFGYVYWATTKYIEGRYDNMILSDRRALLDTYARTGREGLMRDLTSRYAASPMDGDVYLLADAA